MRTAMIFALLFFIGCGATNTAPTEQSATSSSTETKRTANGTTASGNAKAKVNNRPEVPADAFDNVADAVSALTLATDAQFDEERYRATEWLVMQKDAAVAPLAEEVKETSANPRSQIVIARILGRIGTPAAAQELVVMTTAENHLGAINAIQQLGVIKPPSPDTIENLIRLLEHQDDRRRLEAVHALGKIGQPAAAASKQLVAIQNSQDNDTLRQAARRALEKVDPRKTLAD